MLLLGQIFDAIFNIFIGAESDKISLIRGYGRRKGWHLVGSVLCVASLMIFFTPPPMFVHLGTPGWVVLLYLVACQPGLEIELNSQPCNFDRFWRQELRFLVSNSKKISH